MATIEKRVLLDGSITFRAKIRRNGYKSRTATFDTRGDAEAWGRKIETRMDAGNYEDNDEARTTTLYDALTRYRKEFTPLKKGERQELLLINKWQATELARLPLANLRGMDFAEWRDDRLEDGISGSTIRNELNLISALFTAARKDWGMAGLRNPMADVRKPSPGKARDRRLEGDEEERILAAARTRHAELEAVIILLIDTAMRRSEVAGIKRSHVDLTSNVIHLYDTKNGTDRDVPILTTRAAEAIKALPKRITGELFSLTPDMLTYYFRSICKSEDIKGLRLHDIRHEGTSRLVECGKFNLIEIASITGHKTMVMLKRYSHPRAADLAKRMVAS